MAQVVATTVESAGNGRLSEAGSRYGGGKILRAAAYCRVSTLLEEQDGSYETQMRALEERIHADPNLTLVKIYGDHGISGGSAKNRKQFQQMIRDCRDGLIDIILTKSISRFARNLSDTVRYIRELKELGVSVWFERENIRSTDPSMEMLLEILAAAAQEELNDLSQNVKWAVDKSRSAGNPKSNVCYGYRKCMQGDQCVWKICEPEANRVRCAFQMAADGRKYWEILDRLQQMEEDENTGILWYQQRLHNLLCHEAYTGNLIVGKTVHVDCLSKKSVLNHGEYPKYYIEEHHEPLVTAEQFDRVQENLKNGELRVFNSDEIPIRWKTDAWKKKHGFLEKSDRLPNLHQWIRSCYSRTGGGKNSVGCIYGRTDCPGWRAGTGEQVEAGTDCDGKSQEEGTAKAG